MMAKYEERIEVMGLRSKGWSIRHIAQKVGVAKSTVSLWCRDIRLTDEQISVLSKSDTDGAYLGRLRAAENRRNERLDRMGRLMKVGVEKVGDLSKRDLFVAGLALYWAEGSKKHRRVELINSDPEVIKIWISWLKNFAKIDLGDLIVCVGINEIHRKRIGEVLDYWSVQTGIPLEQFRLPSYKKVRNQKVYANFDHHYGSLSVIARRGTNLCYEILGMIKALGDSSRLRW